MRPQDKDKLTTSSFVHEATDTVDRAKLIDACISPTVALTIIEAGAGFGKTFLLNQVADALRHRHQRVCYGECSAGKNDLQAFAGVIADMLAELDIPKEVALSFFRADKPSDILVSYGAVHLLLDDYIPTLAQNRLIDRLVSSLADGSTVILAGRRHHGRYSWSKGLSDRIFRLDQNDLRFDAAEAAELFSGGPSPDPMLVDGMAGWAMGLALLKAILDRLGASPESLVRLQLGNDLARYFRSTYPQLLADTQLWTFLETICVLGRVDLGALEGIVEADNQKLDNINRLIDLDLLTGVKEDAHVLHLLRPFQRFIQNHLAEHDVERYSALVSKAAAQFIKEENWQEAQRVISGAPLATRRTILEGAGGWMLDILFGLHVLTDFQLSDSIDAGRHPRLALAKAIELGRSGLQREARSLFEQIVAQTSEWKDDVLWQAELQVNDTRLRIFSDVPLDVAMVRQLEALMNLDLGERPVLYAIIAAVLCEAHYSLGHYQNSREIGLRGLVLSDHYHAPYAASYVYSLTAMAEYRLGNLAGAAALCDRMAEHVKAMFGPVSPLLDVAALVLATIRYDEGKLDEAEQLLERPLDDVLDHEGLLEIGAAGFITAANIAIRRRDYDRALSIIAAAEEAGARHDLPRLTQIAKCRAVFLLAVADRVHEATSISCRDNFPSGPVCAASGQWREYVSVSSLFAHNALLLARGEFAASLASLDQFLLDNSGVQHVPIYTRAICLKVIAAVGSGRPADEIAELIRTIFLYVEKRGYITPLLELPLMEGTLRTCKSMATLPEDARRLSERLYELFGRSTATTPVVALSPRQTQILNLLSDGLSNKEIASRLDLAEGTVKSYRKTLYQKLDISRRSQAVARARSRPG